MSFPGYHPKKSLNISAGESAEAGQNLRLYRNEPPLLSQARALRYSVYHNNGLSLE